MGHRLTGLRAVPIWFGHERHLFEAEGRWFATGVLAMVWLIVVALLGRYFRDNPPPEA